MHTITNDVKINIFLKKELLYKRLPKLEFKSEINSVFSVILVRITAVISDQRGVLWEITILVSQHLSVENSRILLQGEAIVSCQLFVIYECIGMLPKSSQTSKR